MNQAKVEVHFAHPRSSSTFTAIVSRECTGQQAINGLLGGDESGPFLHPSPAGQPYELVVKRTQMYILPHMTFEQAGVIDGDVIEVRQAGQGAKYGALQT